MPTSSSSSALPSSLRPQKFRFRAGEVNWTILLWAVGVPLPLVLIVGLLRGCS